MPKAVNQMLHSIGLDTKKTPEGYEQSQFYELYNHFVEKNYGKGDTRIVVERIPDERIYIECVDERKRQI
jgi:hypothetical protein